jgi:hypothetical protein
MTDYRALCAELLDWAERTSSHYYKQADVILRARAALAQPDPISDLVSQCRPLEPEMAKYLTPQARWRLYGDEAQPEPVAPTDEELIGPIMWMLDDCVYDNDKGEIAQSLRRLIARWGTPANNTREEN